MTTFASRPTAHTQTTQAERSTLTVEWSLTHNGPATLSITIEGATASATLTPHGGEPTTLATAGPARTETIDGLEHIDIPGIASLTLRPTTGGSRDLLYARTPLLESLGIRGGCVERPRLISD